MGIRRSSLRDRLDIIGEDRHMRGKYIGWSIAFAIAMLVAVQLAMGISINSGVNAQVSSPGASASGGAYLYESPSV